MDIIDLNETYFRPYFCCLEEWSEEMREAGDHKEKWFYEMRDKGLRVKIAVANDNAIGMIQYVPVEQSIVQGQDAYFINCIWVHGHKPGVGNQQKRGIGTQLLQAAEYDIKSMNRKAIIAWGISLPFWMKASWFKKHGYKKADKNGMAVLLWKPLSEDAIPPRWIKAKKMPVKTANRVTVTSFINGWCPAQNIVHERAKRAALEFGDQVLFQDIHSLPLEVHRDWGISDGLFIDGKELRFGPPPSYEKIRNKIAKKAAKLEPE
jgi:hypothetical protein